MDVDDERVFGSAPATDPFMHDTSSLQVPPDFASSATSNGVQSQSVSSRSGPPGRSASVAVYTSSTSNSTPLSPAPQPNAASSRKRASHSVSGSNQHAGARVYPDVYSLPAAVAYANAHPRRQIPKFGPYLLLQTLGEGEFGKVKLGLHMEYGEEVAVKLIRRGSVDNAVRFSKIEREIEVLRHLRHPNIVRLYDVIETDKYIGIIIEYASGGELFDHILAHRYLREKDAAKLFAQLISGVSYLHAKKIVHRDLKLENLLLDRNRNVIITDFGFANKFEHKADDLMQTSCGSPCYAAPELVISEGLYVGSAVDIWSCGVILYAMLAGYLPFDDDPANPDGDNINLLYKYIINTQLTFPEYVSTEARDLLSMMLVPDPAKRCDLDGIKRHPWLRQYQSLFEKSVDELEHQAMEMQTAKRLQYQKMMRTREKETSQQQTKMNRTQSARLDHGTSSSGAPIATTISSSASTRTGRSQHQHEFLYETGGTDLAPPANSGRRVVASAIIPTSNTAAYDDDPFGAARPEMVEPPSTVKPNAESTPVRDDGTRSRKSSTKSKTSKAPPSASKPVPPAVPSSTQNPPGQRKAGAYRHTIQLEYADAEQAQQPASPPPQPQVNGFSPKAGVDTFVASPLVSSPPVFEGAGQATIDASLTPADGVVDIAGNAAVASNGVSETAPVVEVPSMRMPGEYVTEMVNGSVTSDGLIEGGQDTPRKPTRSNSNATPRAKKAPSSIIAPDVPSTNGVSGSPTTPRGSSRSPPAHSPPSPTYKRAPATEPILSVQSTLESEPTASHAQESESSADATFVAAATHAAPQPLPSPAISSSTQGDSRQLEASSHPTPSASSAAVSAVSVTHSVSSASHKSRHRTGLSLDKFSLNKLLGQSANHSQVDVDKHGGNKPPVTGPSKKLLDAHPVPFDPRSVPIPPIPATPATSSHASTITVTPSQQGSGAETASTKSKASRRKTLTLMMAESAKAAVGRDRTKSHRSVTEPMNAPTLPASVPASKRASPIEKVPQTADVHGSFTTSDKISIPHNKTTAPILAPSLPVHDSTHDIGHGVSTGKAKKVMDWFRKRSIAKSGGDSVFTPAQPPTDPHRPPIVTSFEMSASQELEPSTPTIDTYRGKQSNGDSSSSLANAPQVVVTSAEGQGQQQPAGWGPTPRSASGASHTSTDTSASLHSSQKAAPSVAAVSAPTTTSAASHLPPVAKRAAEALANVAFRNPPAMAAAKAFNKAMLRVHHGAVDQAMVTTGSPPDVFEHVTKVLLGMGIEIQRESEFKYRCIRHKRKKVSANAAANGSKENGGLAAVHLSGSAASNGVDKRGLPLPSTNFGAATSGMFRGLLLRRGSHSPAPQFSSSSSSTQVHADGADDERNGLSPVEVTEGAARKEPIYGDRTIDLHDEVRFSVELTRIDRLEDTFSLDIRRLKGNLRSYKFLYDNLRERATLTAL
ncbi:hypothetical protein FRB99_000011 [Tulasnella sp. 403]|nr:hypothetical protein FRB99_000011 [Tulasnella sp. 403]